MPAPGKPFETFEHPADVGIVAYGADLPELFANAAQGMLHFMIAAEQVRAAQPRPLIVEAEDLEGLLVAWLNELLLVLNGEGFVPARFEVATVSPTRLEAWVVGEPVDPRRHRFRLDVKAATYHTLSVKETDGWEARVLFDV